MQLRRPLDREFMLARSRSRDASFDGRFLTGVLSTGIYCLPSCPARRPRPENVRFFASEEEARRHGLRPCLRCKPDRFLADRDPEVELAEELAAEVRRAPGDFADVTALARRAGFRPTQLARLFRRHFHASPADFLLEARVAHACAELASTGRRALDVALDAGFESSSAFHANVKRRTRTTPGAWRGLARAASFELELPPDFRAAETLAAIARDPASVCERASGASCALAVRLGESAARLTIAIAGRRARCELDARVPLDGEARVHVHSIALRVLGLRCEPAAFERRARSGPLAGLVARRPGARVALFADVWEAALWALLGQAVHLRVACARRRALAQLAGDEAPGALRTTPDAARVAELGAPRLAALGLSRAQAEGLAGLAVAVAEGALPLEALARGSAVRAERRLLALAGVGPWTAQYVMLRGFGLSDCAPAGDSALAAALQRAHALTARPDPDEVRRLLQPHAPHRSLATWHLWVSQGEGT